MPLEQDVLQIGRQLEKLVSEGSADKSTAGDLLQRLKEMPITLDILQKTRIGMSVNVVRKATSKEETQSLAKGLIKSWKKLLDGQTDKAKMQRQSSTEKLPDASGLCRNDSSSSLSSMSNSQKPANGTSSVSFPPSRMDVGIRDKCREMVLSSLKCDDVPDVHLKSIASEIEAAIYGQYNDTGPKYRNRIKSRVMNLRDKKNPELRMRVIDGSISAERFATMAPEEMASDALKRARDEITQQAIKDHQLATTGGTGTSDFKCFKCGKRNCTYNQVQTRSADEPMTTFVYCNECGNRWKFC